MRPDVTGVHGDSGNTKAYDGPAPLGKDLQVTSVAGVGGPILPFPMPDGRVTAIQLNASDVSVKAISAVDPTTMAVQASWTAPEGQKLNGYMYQRADGAILATSKQGHVYVLQRTDTAQKTVITLKRDIDLASMGVLGPSENLHSAAFDADGGIWFVTGAVTGASAQTATTTTVGHIDEDGRARVVHLKDQVVENGFAVKNTTAYIVTGPAGAADHANAEGHMYAFGPGGGKAPRILWQQDYDSGSATKPGGLSRGSGSTPTLLGSRYVAITDNADRQSNILVYRQKTAHGGGSQLVCSVPLGAKNVSSSNDNGMIGYVAHGVASLVAQNTYDQPTILPSAGINGSWNDNSVMTGGMQRVDVTPDGRCVTKWNNPVQMRGVPALSTSAGLVYGSAEDPKLSAQGTYVWYTEAIDFRTGRTVWKKRVGAGGTYNDIGMVVGLGPNGTLYSPVLGGVVTVKDSREALN
ncbi:hypothetical protein [Streptomyces sp. NPDC047061]|uniref:hypothetical protein n=1 Tax=Streptomyces sp. NPDC047061 TaxID=3154605 RepID=UPI0033D71F54